MSALARLASSSALAVALASGVNLLEADLFDILLQDGVTAFHFTTYPLPLTVGGTVYQSGPPFLEVKSWNVVNTMEVPEMSVLAHTGNASFNGGGNLKSQLHNGLFDRAFLTYSIQYMATPGVTSTYAPLVIFGGLVADVEIGGVTSTLSVRGKNDLLDQMIPRTLYQVPCNKAFCDPNCTLNIASFTAGYAAGAGVTRFFIPWSGTAPSNAAQYTNGSVTFTSGAAAGQTRNVALANSSGLTLVFPLYSAPAAGDSFNASQGCDWTFNSGSGQSCTDYGNEIHWRGYDQVPPPNMAY